MRWRVVLGLAGALTLLIGLWLPWLGQTPARTTDYFQTGSGAAVELPNLFIPWPRLDGWLSGGSAADLAGLGAVVVAGSALVRLRRRDDGSGWFDTAWLVLAFLGFAALVDARAFAHDNATVTKLHWALYGAGVALAGALPLLAAGLASRRRPPRLRPGDLVVAALTLGFLASLVLPWERVGSVTDAHGVARSPLLAAGVLAVVRLVPGSELSTKDKLALAVGTVLLVVAAIVTRPFPAVPAYGAWLGLALSLALLAAALMETLPFRLVRPSRFELATTGAVALLVVGLLLPWQQPCFPTARNLGSYSGRCVPVFPGPNPLATAALLLGVLVLSSGCRRRLGRRLSELAVALSLFVATLGFQFVSGLEPGPVLSFTGTAVLVVLAGLELRAVATPRPLVRVVPPVLCAVCIAVALVPAWGVLSWSLDRELAFASGSAAWPGVAVTLAAVRLGSLWLGSAPAPDLDRRVLLLPLLLVALAAYVAARAGADGLTWGHALFAAASVLLVWLGRTVVVGGLPSIHVPEILRIDRI